MSRHPRLDSAIVVTENGLEIVGAAEVPRRTKLMTREHAESLLEKLRADGCEACRAGQVVVDFGPGAEF